jgi:hypothetical protein
VSVQALSCAMSIRGVSASEKLLLLVLANYADDKMMCWPSHKRIAEDTSLSQRTILSLLKGLEARGVITRSERHRHDGSRSSDIITLHLGGETAAGGGETISPRGETIAGGVGKSFQGGGEMVSPLTTFEPSLNHQEEPKKISVKGDDAGFERFWVEYPRKVAKPEARKAFAKAWRKLPTGNEVETLIGALERAKAAWTDPQFIPHPATWLNGERWQDEPSTVIPMRRHDQPHHNNRPTSRQDRLDRMLAGAMAAVDEREHGLG